ncbi:DNA mismatch repair protein MutL [Botrytis cinerea]
MSEPMDMDAGTETSRGTKRKAESELPEVTAPGRIKALDPDVVNKIAAGEIIVAPVHALKELIENAVDAGSTSLEVLVKDGGLKLLQITDNGHGINKEDMAILCERFTTSKLKQFEDLTSIGTYGFRGEALASISHIAHLTVTTRTKDSNCAFRAHYDSGRLIPAKPGQGSDPKPIAGRPGTQITVEDLFYNVPTRRRAFRSASEEYNKILDVVGVAFSCKKHGEASTTISTQLASSTVDRIRQIHGSGVANELIEFKSADPQWGFTAQGWTTNANYHVKKTTLLLFINHRAVESTAIRKAIEQTYSAFLPKDRTSSAGCQRSPTKREVNFLNEEEIIEKICNDIRIKLADVDKSRNFMTQTLLPGAQVPLVADTLDPVAFAAADRARTTTRPYENNLVRTDAKLRKITTMLPPTTKPTTTANREATPNPSGSTVAPNSQDIEYTHSDREPIICRLMTIKELRTSVRDSMHNELTEIFASHTFVGIVDERRRLAAIQSGVKLFLVDYAAISSAFFYQVGLTDFGNFGEIPPEYIPEDDFEVEDVVEIVSEQLISRREMLQEYFSLSITPDGLVEGIPLLLKNYTPALSKLPQFLLRLGPHVNWNDEKECFSSFLQELARFYVPEQLPPSPGPEHQDVNEPETQTTSISPELKQRRDAVRKMVEDVLFPAFRSRLLATRDLMGGAVLEVANLKGLYRVFERC